jgi:hypothetical protein
MAPSGQDKWYHSPYVYVLGVLVVLGVLAFVAPVACLGGAVIYYVGLRIWVLMAAFSEGAGTGFMTLCVPFYEVYFVFSVSENSWLKAFYTGALVGIVGVGAWRKMAGGE